MEKEVVNKKEYMYMKVCSGKRSLENTRHDTEDCVLLEGMAHLWKWPNLIRGLGWE